MFHWEPFVSHSGLKLDWKIRCEHLTPGDWNSVATLVASRIKFHDVVGVPRGGLPFKDELVPFTSPKTDSTVFLIVDDVFTTGTSMEEMKFKTGLHRCEVVGVVLFSRAKLLPRWVRPVFQLGISFWD
jgi:hypothetical protein